MAYKKSIQFCRFLLPRISIVLPALLWNPPALGATETLYRYINDQGVKVLDNTIPPRYAQKGYEIINLSGRVLKVVPPAPSAEELEKKQFESEIIFHYDRLKKRYSDVESIESARSRRLSSLDTSIAILKGNISSLQQQLEIHMNRAATREREGKAVPQPVLKQIAGARNELSVAKELLQIRYTERQKVNDKFNKDIEHFEKGKAMVEGQPIQPNVAKKPGKP